MKKKIGAITIGQSPRIDVIPEMQEILGENVIILEAGALDGLTKKDIEKFCAKFLQNRICLRFIIKNF